ncbi:helix-turn-helix transcriptional regulator [uncultured Sphaerochaeta sp.]|uniref:helix-turn-helix domain-containing protein n=1 Tax=uncultured Sphaerochaeta sp. TaxID=886478 RepID=UPI002A0A8AB6|nr:helix-turn-helix transcriptional regulator [uncultured Sphaerochaeta sp.]
MRNKNCGTGFWERVDSLLKQRTMSQTNLARMTGIADGTLSSAKSKKSIPLADTAVNLASALNTTVEYLVSGYDVHDREIGDKELEESVRYICTSRPASRFAKAMPFLSLYQYETLECLLRSWGIQDPGETTFEENVAERPDTLA